MKAKLEESIADKLEAARNNPNIPEVQVVVKAGRITETLSEQIIEPYDPDLVICGERGLSNIKYVFVGSVSTYLIRNLRCDVLVVKKTNAALQRNRHVNAYARRARPCTAEPFFRLRFERRDKRLRARTRRRHADRTRAVGTHGEIEQHVIVRRSLVELIAPLHQRHAIAFSDAVVIDVVQFVGVLQAIQIEVIQRQSSAAVFAHQVERRARRHVGKIEAACEALREVGFPASPNRRRAE